MWNAFTRDLAEFVNVVREDTSNALVLGIGGSENIDSVETRDSRKARYIHEATNA
jgi:hypothetical protein